MFETAGAGFRDQYLRLFLSQKWRQRSRKSLLNIHVTSWGAFYAEHAIENKLYLNLGLANSTEIRKNLFWQGSIGSQIKKFVTIQFGFFHVAAASSLIYELSRNYRFKLSGYFQQYQFFQDREFDTRQILGMVTLSQVLQPQFVMDYSLELSREVLPNRKLFPYAFIHYAQKNKFYGFNLGFTWQKELFLRGNFHFENEHSNFSGLDYSLGYADVTAAVKICRPLIFRSNVRWQVKKYGRGDGSYPVIGIDPEVGAGSNGNFDLVYSLSQKSSLILRARLLKQESTVRNRYYAKRIFELILEMK